MSDELRTERGRFRADASEKVGTLAAPVTVDAATLAAITAASKRGDKAEVDRLIALARSGKSAPAPRLDAASVERAALAEMNRDLMNAHKAK